MRVMIAYDGSTYAAAAVDDLARAGLPSGSEILIVSVVDLAADEPIEPIAARTLVVAARVDAIIEQARKHKAEVVGQTREMAKDVENRIRRDFPRWHTQSEVLNGRPDDELLRRADEWAADLLVGGSQGRSAIGRFFLGSVSRSAAERSGRSVRIVRRGLAKSSGEPIELILGVKNPAEAELLAEKTLLRTWPGDTRVRLVVVEDAVAPAGIAPFYADGKSVYETAAERLASAGLTVSVQIESGEPKTIFLEAANNWRADAIFIAGSHANDQRGLDDTAAALVTDANCTVELVR